ncbi:MAG: hypothetical protein ACI4LE_04025, partial [Faecalibacterium sp.]
LFSRKTHSRFAEGFVGAGSWAASVCALPRAGAAPGVGQARPGVHYFFKKISAKIFPKKVDEQKKMRYTVYC